MPELKYACDICGEIFPNESEARACEDRGREELKPVGLLFSFYIDNHTRFSALIVSAKHDGHDAKYEYITEDGCHEVPKDKRTWNIRAGESRTWSLLKHCYARGIAPTAQISDSYQPLDYVSLEELFSDESVRKRFSANCISR